MRLKRIYISIVMVAAGLAVQAVLALPAAAATYETHGIATSTNLLFGSSASSITNFHYNLSYLPATSSVIIQFSNDGSTWYSAANVSGGSTTLSLSPTGGTDLSLSALGWSGTAFYYKMTINSTSNQSATPTIDDIRLDYTPTSGYENVFVFDNYGNVGIGTTSPSGKLDIHGAGTTTGINTQWADLTGAAKVTILDNGNMGIGTTAPTDKLDIAGGVKIGAGYVGIGLTAPLNGLLVQGNTGIGTTLPSQLFQVNNSGASAIVLTSGGNVGIGITSPTQKLSVVGAGLFSAGVYVGVDTSTNSLISTSSQGAGSTTLYIGNLPIATAGSGGSISGTQNLLAKFTSTTAVGDSRFFDNGTNIGIGNTNPLTYLNIGNAIYMTALGGNVGIGTTNPGFPLHVVASNDDWISKFTNTLGAGSNVGRGLVIEAGDSTIATHRTFELRNKNGGQILTVLANGNVGIGTVTPGTAGLAVMNGNVGIGTTAPQAALQTYGTLKVAGSAAQNVGTIVLGDDLTTAQSVGMYRGGIGTVGGAHTLNLAGYDGVAFNYGHAAFGAQTVGMFLKNDGNVGIGTTNPSALLTVEKDSVGIGATDAALLLNITSATVGLSQYSPALHFVGQTWNTGASASQTAETIAYLDTLHNYTGASSSTGNATLTFATRINGGAYTTVFAVDKGGNYMVVGSNFYVGGSSGTGTVNATTFGNIGSNSTINLYAGATNRGGQIDLTGGGASTNPGTIVFRTGLTGTAPENMRIDASGNVGIGTTSPSGRLDIHGAGTTTGINTQWADLNGAAKVSILDNGNVGIGTTAPANKLEIKSSGVSTSPLLIVNSANTNNLFYAREDSTGDGQMNLFNLAGTSIIQFTADGVSYLNGGNVGIGTTSPNARLQARGSGSTTNWLFHLDDSTGADRVTILDNGNVGIGTTAPGYKLEVYTGTATGFVVALDGSWGNVSDARLKKNINPMSSSLEKVMALDPVTYNFKTEPNSNPSHMGFIAQDVEKIAPELVSTGPNGYMGISYAMFTPMLVKAVQEQQTQISDVVLKTSQNVETVGQLQKSVDENLTVISSNFSAVDTKLALHDSQMANVNSQLTSLGTEVSVINTRLTSLDTQTSAIVSQVSALNGNMSLNEAEKADLESRLSAAEAKLLTDEHDLITFEKGTNDTLSAMLVTEDMLTSRVLDHEDRIKVLEAKLAAMTVSTDGSVVTIPANVITQDALGNVTLAGIFTAKGIVAGSADINNLKLGAQTSGSGKIISGQTEIVILSTEVKSDSKIYVTPTGSTEGKILYVGKEETDIVPGESFKVKFDGAPAAADVQFNWLIVN